MSGERGSPWTRPPEQPTPYHVISRATDMLHGWLDGKKGIPKLPEAAQAAEETQVAAGVLGEPAGDLGAAARLNAAISPQTLETPRIHVLARHALERIRTEEIRFRDECASLKPEYARFLAAQDATASQLIDAEKRLNQARQRPADGDLSSRRLAERDVGHRPDDLVRGRRHAEWQRRLAAVEREYHAVAERHAEATRAAILQEQLIRDRAAVAQAAARRHHELAMRRIASYLQQLVRTHKRGADLNLLVIGQPVGPELPKWVTSADESHLASETGSQ